MAWRSSASSGAASSGAASSGDRHDTRGWGSGQRRMEKRKAQADFRRDESNLQHAEKGARWQQHAEEMQQVEEARARVLHVHAKVQATLAKAHEDHAEAMNDDAKIRTWHANTSYSIDALNNSANITRRKVQELQKWGKVARSTSRGWSIRISC
jgi:hypothetical protein